MNAPTVRWKLNDYLKERGKTAYALIQTSGLARATVYAINRGEPKAVELETLAKLAAGLETLTGEQPSLSDLLEFAADPDPESEADDRATLDAAAADLAAHLAELEADEDPAELEAWRSAFEAAAAPGQYVPGQGFRSA